MNFSGSLTGGAPKAPPSTSCKTLVASTTSDTLPTEITNNQNAK